MPMNLWRGFNSCFMKSQTMFYSLLFIYLSLGVIDSSNFWPFLKYKNCFYLHNLFLCICMCMYDPCVTQHTEARRGHLLPWSCQRGWCELNSGFLDEQPVMPEGPSLSSPRLFSVVTQLLPQLLLEHDNLSIASSPRQLLTRFYVCGFA